MAESQETVLQKIKDQGDLVRKLKAAKEPTEKVNSCTYDFEEIDRYLSRYSYICGYMPSRYDKELIKELGKIDFNKYKYMKRWWYHMRSFSDLEISLLPTSQPPNIPRIANKNNQCLSDQVCV